MQDEEKERAIPGSAEFAGSTEAIGSDTIDRRVDRLIALYFASSGYAGETTLGIGGEPGEKGATPAMGSGRTPTKELGPA